MPPMGYPPGYWPAYASGIYLVLLLLWLAVMGVPLIRILTKAGYSGWWALLALAPLVNLVALWVFAFGRWPALEEFD